MTRGVPFSLRVPLMVMGLMVLVGLVASQLVLGTLQTTQQERVQELVRLHVDGLATALGPAVLREDVWEVYDILNRAGQAMVDGRMVLTVAANRGGRIIAASDPVRAAVDADLEPMASDAQTIDAIRLSGPDGHLRVLTPLLYQGRPVGQLLSELDVTDLIAERRRAVLVLLIGNGFATAVLSLGGFLLVRRMLTPLRHLTRHMATMQGRPQAIPDVQMPRRDPELVTLFQTYNAMSAEVQARVDAERRLAERERFVSLGRLSSSLAHEINNPLGGLLNATDTIRTYPDRADVVREASALIDRGLRHLRDVVGATLDQHRTAPDRRPLKQADFDDLRLLFKPEAARMRQHLDWQVIAEDEGLGAWPAGPVRQIILNLLLNAGLAAGDSGRVAFVAEARNGLSLTVCDTGPGLSRAAQERLLEDRPLPPGGGLGLRMIRDLSHSLSGNIRYDRHDGMTRITITLPQGIRTC